MCGVVKLWPWIDAHVDYGLQRLAHYLS
jgi:hypothetical protein